MKNRLFKIILTMLCLCAVLCVLAGCDQLGSNTGGLTGGGCQHEYGDWELFSDGECQERIYKHVCSKCQNLEWKEGSDADHVWEEKTVEPTCTTEGSLLSVCSVCEKSEVKETLPLAEHLWEEKTIEPTCTTEGSLLSVCSICEKSEVKETLPRIEHKWKEGIAIEPTCLSDGLKTIRCALCGTGYNQSIPKLEGHVYTQKYDSKQHWDYCDICDVRVNTESHSYGSDNTCSVCGYEKPSEERIITIWVSEAYGITDLTQRQIDRFLEANPEYKDKYIFEIKGVSEADAASQVIADVALAPDIFCFSQDQLSRLVQANALAAPGQRVAANLKAANDAISISAASVAGTLYAYPLTSDNGYYMYYDKSVITDPDDLAQIVDDCEKADKNICFELENAWYTASFFMATGCYSNWTMADNVKFTAVDDTYNSPEGLIAMKGMQIVTKSWKYMNSSSDFANAGIVVTGIWNDYTARKVLGDNYAVADLPCFTIDGNTYHLASFSGHKLMGVKPQSDPAKASMLSKLAEYLTGAECQLERYNEFSWIPSNLEAKASDAIKSNDALTALAEQNKWAIPQGNIHNSWWDIAKMLGSEARTAQNDSELQAALDNYSANIDALFQRSDEDLFAWSVIGSIGGTMWDTDFRLTQVSDNVFESDVFELHAGEEFKIRQGGSWNVNFGGDGQRDSVNFVVQNDGRYIILFILHDATSATIELIPQV